MTAQILEIAGQKMAVLPIADYERLIDIAEDRIDLAAAVAAHARREAGEEYVPAALVARIIDGEHPLKAWREYRAMSQAALSRASGVPTAEISHIECGRRAGTAAKLTLLASVLNITVDDLLIVT